MASMSTYSVVYERDEGQWWIARVLGVKGVHSNGRTIEEARRRVREALSLAVDDADDAEFVEDVKIPAALRKLVSSQRTARERAATEQARAVELEREAAQRLTSDLRLSRRDIGELLGLSHQSVQKLVASRAKTGRGDPRSPARQRSPRTQQAR
jgi:predicted RNase H-like HicB family nuclease